MKQTLEERLEQLTEAQDLLQEAADLIRHALKGTNHEAHAESYILGHLENWIDARGYDTGIEQYKKMLEEDETEEEED